VRDRSFGCSRVCPAAGARQGNAARCDRLEGSRESTVKMHRKMHRKVEGGRSSVTTGLKPPSLSLALQPEGCIRSVWASARGFL
jgi:hypothetical protein